MRKRITEEKPSMEEAKKLLEKLEKSGDKFLGWYPLPQAVRRKEEKVIINIWILK